MYITAISWYKAAIMDEPSFEIVLKNIIDQVSGTTGHGAVCHTFGRELPFISRNVCGFCRYCLEHPVTAAFCKYAIQSAAMQTLTSGEPHYQRCWAGLLQVAVALAPTGEYLGGIALGGVYATGEDAGLPELLQQRLGVVPGADVDKFVARLHTLQEMDAGTLQGMGLFLFEATLSSGINSASWFRRQNQEYLRQREIAEACIDLKNVDIKPPDIMADTYQLVSYLHKRDRTGAMSFISQYLAKLLMLSNWNLVKLRAYVRVLLAVITSQDILDGMDWGAASRREWLYMTRIEKATGTEAICSEVADLILEHFGRKPEIDAGHTLADRVVAWLERNAHQRATLQDLSRAVGASVSSIAHQLPKETGKTFAALRREIRIARAKRLLATTSMDISAIADACGFVDQSHFTRVFRREISLTPGMFRKML